MKTFIYIYDEAALSVLTRKQLSKVYKQQGRFDKWRILHTNEEISGKFFDAASVVAAANDASYQIIKANGFPSFDVLSTVLDFGQSLQLVA